MTNFFRKNTLIQFQTALFCSLPISFCFIFSVQAAPVPICSNPKNIEHVWTRIMVEGKPDNLLSDAAFTTHFEYYDPPNNPCITQQIKGYVTNLEYTTLEEITLEEATFRFEVKNNTEKDFYNAVLSVEFASLDRAAKPLAEAELTDINATANNSIPIINNGTTNGTKGILTTFFGKSVDPTLRVPEIYLGHIASGGTKSGSLSIEFDSVLPRNSPTRRTLEISNPNDNEGDPDVDVFWARPNSLGVSEFPEKPGFPSLVAGIAGGVDPQGPLRPKSSSNVSVFYNLISESTKIRYKTKDGEKVVSLFDSDTRQLSFQSALLGSAFIFEDPSNPRYDGDPLLNATLEVDSLTLFDEFTVGNSYTFSGGIVRIVKDNLIYFEADLPYFNVHDHNLANTYENWGELVNFQFPQGLGNSLILTDMFNILNNTNDGTLLDFAIFGDSIATVFNGFPQSSGIISAELDVGIGGNGIPTDVPEPSSIISLVALGGIGFLTRNQKK